MSGTDKPKPSAAKQNPATIGTEGSIAPSNYLDPTGKTRTLVTISREDNPAFKVQGIIPPEYGFSVRNTFAPLLTVNQGLDNFQKGINAIDQLVYSTGASVVPYSPQIWMGAEPLTITELVLHFVAFTSAFSEVHIPLMNLLSMSLPKGLGGEFGGIKGGMLSAPPAVEVKIGDVISWKPCFIQSAIVTEKAPYTKEGYGMTGEAKINIIRRDYIFADDFMNTGSKEPRVVAPRATKKT